VVLRDEVVVWDGIIWTRRRRRDGNTNSVEFAASELPSYFTHRVLRPELGYGSGKNLAFTQADMFDILRALIADAANVTWQNNRVGDIGIEADPTIMSGVLVDRRDTPSEQGAYHGYQFTTHAELINALCENDPSMEWRIDSYLDENRALRRRLMLGAPRLGTPPDSDALITLEYPGRITSYEWSDDGENAANYVAALGSGDGDNQIWAEAYNSVELGGGYPLTELATSYKDDTSLTVIQGRAVADLASHAGDRTVPSLEVQGYVPLVPGDHIRVRIADEDWWPGSSLSPFEDIVRVVGITVSPGPPEVTTLQIEEPRS
jgi:hypothetical protein